MLEPGRPVDADMAVRLDCGVLHEMFERQVDARPEAVAVIAGGEQVTYGGLEANANQLAHHLHSLGVRRGAVVAMLLPRSIDAYATILGILKAGAAYVPIDVEYPRDRVAYILDNCGAAVVVTTAELADRCAPFGGATVRVDADRCAIAAARSTRPQRDEIGVGADDLCYIIYTSGSTGRPKGVMVEHGNVSHLVDAESRIYRVESNDRVYQGASLAFDLSVEEIWLAFHAGATLVSAPAMSARAGPDLSRFLTKSGVTVFSGVPTQLSTMDACVPGLRLLILGGEACPDSLVTRWTRPGLRIVNTYGPTETTVIATCAEVVAGKRVTIGRAVPGYRVYLLDEHLRPVPTGQVGEICVGGAGVARGYVGLPEETRTRFVPDPFVGEGSARMYRTGDLGREAADGNIEFVGRLDGQIKLRGYRIELSEIEAVLLEVDGVAAAACAVREDVAGVQYLAGYVVANGHPLPDEERLRAHVSGRLPAYMRPAIIESISELPRLASGKIDRSALPAPRARTMGAQVATGRARTEIERRIADVWSALFQPLPVGLEDDFFRELGGHSLLAARMISELRKDPRFAAISMMDVYRYPTIASLAAAFAAPAPRRERGADGAAPADAIRADTPRDSEARERGRHFVTGAIQAASVWFALGVKGLPWVTPYLVLFLLRENGYPLLDSMMWAAVAAMGVFPAMILVAIATKWLVLGRVRPGRYRLWGAYYLRWWFVHTVTDAARLVTLSGTPLLPFVYRLFGARIGRNVYMSTDRIAAMDLISIGDRSSIDERAALLGYTVEDGKLVIGPISIGSDCFVGSRAVLREYVVLEDGARLEDLTMVPGATRVPAGETWAGSPARRVARHDAPPPRPEYGPVRRAATVAIYALLLLVLNIVELVAFFPGLVVITRLDFFSPGFFLALPVVGAAFVALLGVQVVLLKWLLVGRVRAGTYAVHGSFYIRNWLVDRLLELSLGIMAQVRATLYVAPWYRALGAKIGRGVELSTASSSTPDLIELADGSTIADEVSLGSPRIEGGWMTVAATRIGRRAFIGNSAVVPVGTNLGDGSLIGVLSIAPDGVAAARPGASWLGSPPIPLPRRETTASFSEQRTYAPPRKLRLARGAFELLRVTLPPAGLIFVTSAVINAAIVLWQHFAVSTVLLLLPFLYTAACAIVLGAVALVKWTVVGRYRPFVRPLWSHFVWRLELVNALYEFLAAPLALESLQGTPLLPWYLRLLGARIGRRVYIETTGFLEWDLIQIGDRVALNEDCILQTHLFEDRMLKASWLRIGADCEVGDDSVVLYDTEMQKGSRLHAVSLLMKGETLPAHTAWAGSPLETSWSVATRRCDGELQSGTAA